MSARRSGRARAAATAPINLDIVNLSHEGRGVARHEGKTVFVHGALPGEQVRAQVTDQHGRFDEADALTVAQPHAERVVPRCPHYGVCGGCSLQHASETAQLAHKQAVLLELLLHQGGTVPRVIAAPMRGPQWGYRRKARLGVKWVLKKGRMVIGFRERAKPYVADCETCAVLDPRVGTQLPALRALIAALSIADRVPQIEVAVGDHAVALVLRHLAALSPADRAVLAAFETASGMGIFLQSGGPDSVIDLHGQTPLLDYSIDGLTISFQPTDFTQVNAEINQQMVAQALTHLALSPTDQVADLFCGIGNFTLPIATRAAGVTGVEGDASLVARARANAMRNGIGNAHFAVANLDDAAAVATLALGDATKILLDPPRAGALVVIEHANLSACQRLVYVSCNPVTFARDAALLVARHGFILDHAGILDMFPQTAHVEAIALFTRA